MGLLQPSFETTLTIKNYTGGGGTEKTIEEIITLMKAINSNFNIFYFDPYNYPYIVGGAVCPEDTTDIYMINEKKYTEYTNMVGIRGEKNGVAVNIIPYNSMSPMYRYNQYGNTMITAGVSHNFTSRMFDGNSYSIANGNYQNDFIFLTTLKCNIYINGNKIVNTKIKVNYYLPDYDYTYAKITYKQDSEPASETDGESVEILKDETLVNIEGLEEDKTYYFKIFTDKSESEAFPYTVGPITDPVPPEYKQYIEWINGSGNLFKKLTYNQNSINSYTYQGTTYYHKITIDPQQTSFLQKVYAMDYDTSSVTKWGIEDYTYQGYTGIYYGNTSSVNQLLTLEINSTETEGLYTLSIPQLTMSYLTNTNMVADLLITQNGEFYKISGTTSGYDTQRSKTVTSDLEGIFKFIWHHFHNVNIKVNGVYWSKVS